METPEPHEPKLPPPFPPQLPSPHVPKDPLPFRNSRHRRISAIVSIFIILIYAGFFRWAFATPAMFKSGGVVSLSFIWSVPFACGFLSVAIGRWAGSDNWILHSIALPVGALILGLVISVVLKFEAVICVIMASPILVVAAVIGGFLGHFVLPRNSADKRLQVTFAVFLPFLCAYAESMLHWPTETKAIGNTIDIQAPPEVIWPEIASVREIPRKQIRDRWIYQVGFPKPIAATLDREGVGGIRTATFERDVSFHETITEWDKPHRLSFSIHADPDFIPHTAFDQHIIVGGRFYDVLDGIYEIEPLPSGGCRLHLTSHHRLSTRFNSYAGWWSVKVMDQIQGSILEVIKQRAEEAAK